MSKLNDEKNPHGYWDRQKWKIMSRMSVLIIEAQPIISDHLTDVLHERQIASVNYPNVAAALTDLDAGTVSPEIALLTMKASDDDMISLLAKLGELGAGLIIASTQTGRLSEDIKDECLAVLDKPFSDDDLINCFDQLIASV